MKQHIRVVIASGALACLLSGCGSGGPGKAEDASVPVPNRRLKLEEKYSDLIGKDGKPIWKPGQKMVPPGSKSHK